VATKTAAVVVSDKLDGVSALVVAESSRKTKKMFTRGDGVFGRDVSHLLSVVRVPALEHQAITAVRGELIIPKSSFAAVGASSGQHARNIVAGVVNAVTPNLAVLRHVRFVAYEVVAPADLPPHRQFSLLLSSEEEVAHHAVLSEFDGETLARILQDRKAKGTYAVDGVVVALRDVPYSRTGTANKGSLNYTNAFAFKDGRGDASSTGENAAEVEVDRVEWSASKDGLLKPVVVFAAPVDLGGASVRRATGFNADFVVRNGLGAGAKVVVTRSGEVIPHIVRVTHSAKHADPRRLLPDTAHEWTASGKDIVRVAKHGDGDEDADAEVRIRRLVHFAKVMGMEGLRERTLHRLFHEGGVTTAGKLVRATPDELAAVPGVGPRQAKNIHASIKAAMGTADCLDVLHASNAFGQGFGERKLRELTAAAFPDAPDDLAPAAAASSTALLDDARKTEELRDRLLRHPGVQSTTADAFIAGLAAFRRFQRINGILCQEKKPRQNKKETVRDLDGLSFVFSGFRDADLEKRLLDRGAEVKSSVSRATTALVVPDASDHVGTKVLTARRHGVPLKTRNDMMSM